jgi:predicted small lipoprotein YifL
MEVIILMKKFLSLFLYLTCILTLAACGKKAAPITLPQADEIASIDITFEENTVSHSDKTWMSEIIADISSSEPTKKESVQDAPRVESYIKIDFRLETGTITIFAYEDRGKYYLEQPYQGIYKIERKLFERLQETD